MLSPIKEINILTDKVLIFGGPYSNLEATLAMQLQAGELGIEPNSVICTGDSVAYCANPSETVDVLINWGIHWVKGNCEDALAENSDDCGCGFNENSLCSIYANQWFDFASESMTESQRHFMGNLPKLIKLRFHDYEFMIVHGTASSMNEFVFPSTSKADKERYLSECNVATGIIGGHSGIPFGQEISSKKYWLNAGVIGMPANDGTSRGWFLVLSYINERLEVRWERLDYNVQKSEQKMHKQERLWAYADSLISGVWPSFDILPDAERLRAGVPIEIEPIWIS